jgi:TRAP-type C4-dicarboxylate transport system permease small subunit
LLLGLGWPQWLTIFALVGGLILTFWLMARASVAYEKARKAREQQANKTEEVRKDKQQ